MAKQLHKPAPPKRRRTGKTATYWVVFVLFALASFAGGFWFTYRGTQVSIKEPPVGPAPSTMPVAAATPDAVASDAPVDPSTPAPIDPFAAAPAPSTTPAPAGTPLAAATSDPFGSELPADDGQPATPTPAPADSGKVFRVQVGSYDTQTAAQSMVDELSAAGIHAAVVQDASGQYHAQIGAYSKRDRALSVADEVNAKGYSVTIRQ